LALGRIGCTIVAGSLLEFLTVKKNRAQERGFLFCGGAFLVKVLPGDPFGVKFSFTAINTVR
jgi:hypothetical protein